ncbi:MAG TPA: TonB family protein, partial [Thermoanaerobaculia bacterium]|nr:TonB family protein [Thermoanaerobaculia bacterium]
QTIGYPIMIKAAAGGGGRGMRIARNEPSLVAGFHAARSEAEAAFGDGTDIGGGPVDDQPIHIMVGMIKPQVVHQVQPRYTEAARRAGVQGSVIVEAIIDEKGNVDNVRVLRGLPMGLDKSAIEAIQQWRFTPATMSNRPVKVYFTLTVNFTIQR